MTAVELDCDPVSAGVLGGAALSVLDGTDCVVDSVDGDESPLGTAGAGCST